MAIVTATPAPANRRPRRSADSYSGYLRSHPATRIDPYHFPSTTGGLGDLGADAPAGTGIDFVDINLTQMHQQIDQAATYAKITAGFSIAGGIASLYLLYLAARKPRKSWE